MTHLLALIGVTLVVACGGTTDDDAKNAAPSGDSGAENGGSTDHTGSNEDTAARAGSTATVTAGSSGQGGSTASSTACSGSAPQCVGMFEGACADSFTPAKCSNGRWTCGSSSTFKSNCKCYYDSPLTCYRGQVDGVCWEDSRVTPTCEGTKRACPAGSVASTSCGCLLRDDDELGPDGGCS